MRKKHLLLAAAVLFAALALGSSQPATARQGCIDAICAPVGVCVPELGWSCENDLENPIVECMAIPC